MSSRIIIAYLLMALKKVTELLWCGPGCSSTVVLVNKISQTLYLEVDDFAALRLQSTARMLEIWSL